VELFKSKQMKALYLSIILIAVSSVFFSYSQVKYLPLIQVKDQLVIDSIENQYFTKKCKSIIYDRSYMNTDCDIILVISCCNVTRYWVLKNDSIIANGNLESDSIFLYQDYKKAGAINKERFTPKTFIPPILGGINTENVVYKDDNAVFYFEFGKNIVSHKELPERKKHREEWLKIIRHELNPIISCD